MSDVTSAPAATELIRPLDQVTPGDARAAGMKAAMLGGLSRSGLPVPRGFVILAPAYDLFAREAALDARIAVVLADRDLDDRTSLQEATLRVRQVIESESLPASLADAIVRAYDALGARPVAVRASGPEFAAAQSLGGIFDSFLGVDDRPELLAAVKRCWSSRFSADHLLLSTSGSERRATWDLAVLVQVQVPATRAGIAFTVDPATGDEDRIVIEAGFGLSAGIVSGAESADRYVLDKKNLVVLDHRARSARRRIERVDGMTAVRGADAAEADAQVMTDSELRRLAALVTTVEQRWSDAQEIEWACDDNGKLWIVQARALPRPEAARPAGAKPLLHGLGAARGRASGRVRLAGVDPSGIQLAPGDVFVAHVTSPDTIPPLHLAGAIVTDGGSMSSHAAVAARWLGIPCVVGTAEATNVLAEGQMITVDGDRGLVLEATRAG
jgi:pyruvate,water dikinase